jgi:IS4 transposase
LDGVSIHFGQGHDSKYGDETIASTPSKGISIMDRGFASSERIQTLLLNKDRYFVLRIKNNAKIKLCENGESEVWSGKRLVRVRLVNFCDLELQTEYRFVTNLPESGEVCWSSEEVGEIYKKRWQIELVWKFLKMHLKLAKLITKNPNGIEIQIYSCLIAYLLLQLVEIPQEFGQTLLDKLCYLQAFMCEKISYVHWFGEILRKF